MYNILVIEDDPDVLEVICTMLQDHYDCNIEHAENGAAALEMASKNKYDLICTDHRMPIMNGGRFITLLRGKRNLNLDTPVLIITGYSDEVLHYPKGLKNVFYLNKPITPSQLYQCIDEVLAPQE